MNHSKSRIKGIKKLIILFLLFGQTISLLSMNDDETPQVKTILEPRLRPKESSNTSPTENLLVLTKNPLATTESQLAAIKNLLNKVLQHNEITTIPDNSNQKNDTSASEDRITTVMCNIFNNKPPKKEDAPYLLQISINAIENNDSETLKIILNNHSYLNLLKQDETNMPALLDNACKHNNGKAANLLLNFTNNNVEIKKPRNKEEGVLDNPMPVLAQPYSAFKP